jgi:hypothetical protein
MSCRAGITTRPSDRQREWKQKYPGLYNWQLFGPFSNRSLAQAWENNQPCVKSGGGDEPDSPNVKWYGYRFDY